MTKTQRQHRIGELIERERISTAAQLVTRLQSEGISATQATVTRDLQELGTIKVRETEEAGELDRIVADGARSSGHKNGLSGDRAVDKEGMSSGERGDAHAGAELEAGDIREPNGLALWEADPLCRRVLLEDEETDLNSILPSFSDNLLLRFRCC